MDYAYIRLRAAGREFRAAYDALRAENYAALRPAQLWGAFHGLFGLASNELVVVAFGDVGGVQERLAALPSVAAADALLLEPTVRPTAGVQRAREGLYVFRFFGVAHRDVDEIAAISAAAWQDFEHGSDYQAVPQGLFKQLDRTAPDGKMLLCTWYDGLNSWQASRTPPGQAGERFRRRGAMTQWTVAYATRLLL